MKIHLLLLVIGSWVTGGDIPAQKTYSLSGNYAVSIHGTFSIHDWSETIGRVSGELVGTVNGDGSADIKSIRMVMEVRSIKSDMGSVMNNKTYKALKGDANPEISFLFAGTVVLNRIAEGNKAVPVKGRLTLAGATREVIMSIKLFKATAGTIYIEGEQKIKMTDFGVKPPAALFGIMRADPDITINFKTNFSTQQK